MLAPTAPLGKDASSSCVNLAITASTLAIEMWLLLRFFRCLAASSGASGAKATTMANAIVSCLRRLLFIFLWGVKA
jgi:hypothetical protein